MARTCLSSCGVQGSSTSQRGALLAEALLLVMSLKECRPEHVARAYTLDTYTIFWHTTIPVCQCVGINVPKVKGNVDQ